MLDVTNISSEEVVLSVLICEAGRGRQKEEMGIAKTYKKNAIRLAKKLAKTQKSIVLTTEAKKTLGI